MALASAVSANSTIAATVKLADKAYWQIKTGGNVKVTSFIHTHYLSIQGVLQDGCPHGRKCRALYQNLIGNETEVPVDIWMMRYFHLAHDVPNKSEFDLIETAVRQDAEARGITPAQSQAELWCEARGKVDDFSDYLRQLPMKFKEGE